MIDLWGLSPLSQFILLTVIPATFMFTGERLTLRAINNASWGYEWVRRTFWMHPNFISYCRYPMGIISALIFHAGVWLPGGVALWQHLGTWCFTFWIITDVSDGTIARYFDLHTEEGKSIDPMSDKLLLFPPLFYFSWLGYADMTLLIVYAIFDFTGQFSRHFIKNTAASLFGKAKTFLTVVTIVLLTCQIVYFGGETWIYTKISLWGAVFLGFFSMFFKIVPSYWYANVLSILNFVCGLVGIYLVLALGRVDLAFAAVFIGQFLDLFDGRAADKWGSTPRGELLDDLADGTNFGGTIAIIIFAAVEQTNIAAGLALLHFGTTSYRLVRFLANKKKLGQTGGVEVFMGLPSPAGALVAGSIILLDVPLEVKIGVVVANSLLMISKVPYIHFGRVILPSIPKIVTVIVLTLILVSVLVGYSTNDHQLLYWTVFACTFSYVILGFPWKKKHKLQQEEPLT